MSRKTLLILIIAGILIISGGLWYLFSRGSSSGSNGQTTSAFKNFLPFGGASAPVNTTSTTTPAGTTNQNQGGISGAIQASSKFHQITDYAVVGATFLEDSRPIQKLTEIPSSPSGTNTPTQPTTTTPSPTTSISTSTPTVKSSTTTPKISTPAPIVPPAPTSEMVPSLRYVKSLDGHVFEMFLDTKATGEISNSTIPAIHETLFGNESKSLIYRYASDDGKTIESFLGTLGATKGEFLPENISDVSISSDGSKYFYLTPFSNGVSGVIQSFNDTKKNQIFSSPFTEWLTDWPNPQMILITTKASAGIPGYVYSINTTNGTLTRILGGVSGLTTKGSPNGTSILYSTSTNNGPKLGLYAISSHSSKDLGQSGLPEKCVWSPDSINIYCAIPNLISGTNYPDAWYQGLVSFTDSFIKINTATGTATFIADSSNKTAIDGTHLFLDDKEQNLFFINKKDSTLWSLNLK